MFFVISGFESVVLGVYVELAISLTSSQLIHGICLCLSELGLLW